MEHRGSNRGTFLSPLWQCLSTFLTIFFSSRMSKSATRVLDKFQKRIYSNCKRGDKLCIKGDKLCIKGDKYVKEEKKLQMRR